MTNLAQFTLLTQSFIRSFKQSDCGAYIQPLVDQDTEFMQLIGIDPRIWRFARFPKSTPESFNHYFTNVLSDEGSFLFSVRLKETDAIIGFTRLKNMDFDHRRAETGTWLIGDQQGKGLNKYIKQQLLTIAFDVLQLNEVYCYVNCDNHPSVKSLLSLGFEIKEAQQRLSPTHNEMVDMQQYYLHMTAEMFQCSGLRLSCYPTR
ncbi:GNAT family N-acetyltransferase [Shewanella colwelliana]|uniref:GNAT family N-acetyltransferase n=2 Tax=Shewanella colwelliana TaxID=23 RepID=UPI00299CD604|nr:GNAT family N-acetyltransferase [Shewanella colwelliana]MDX1279636.1 GNAT family N-acetyltransferase [Shewanella colwelliana]